jgi:beta-lactamase regulating signal transducer with metallopeptidase domain
MFIFRHSTQRQNIDTNHELAHIRNTQAAKLRLNEVISIITFFGIIYGIINVVNVLLEIL